MPPRLDPLIGRPIGFAHRGARAHAPENTIEGFSLAVKLGATGIESDVWVTSDGVAVLDHDGTVGSLLRRRSISEVRRDHLPDHIPSLAEYYDAIGTQLPLSLDVKDPSAIEATLAAARNASGGAEEQLWLCHPDYETVATWRPMTEAKLVDSTRRKHIDGGVERRANELRGLGIDAINLRRMDWTAGMVTTFHRFGRLTLGWDAQQPREIANLLDMGIDGVFSDHVDRLSEALNQFFPEG